MDAGAPPAVLSGFRVLEYAVVRDPVRFSGRTHFYVGDKELGRVSRLAIGEELDGNGIAILHATPSWRVRGVQGRYDAIAPAKERAERMYPGISQCWVKAKVSRRQARAYWEELWRPFACSFCGKAPPELMSPMAASRRTEAVICLACARRFRRNFESE